METCHVAERFREREIVTMYLAGMLGLKAWPRHRGQFVAASASCMWPQPRVE